MKNQGFGILALPLVPWLPLVYAMDRQSDLEVLDDIAHFQEIERGRIRPLREFIEATPEEILYGESPYYESYRDAPGLAKEIYRAAINWSGEVYTTESDWRDALNHEGHEDLWQHAYGV
jgi:hypothetical protein